MAFATPLAKNLLSFQVRMTRLPRHVLIIIGVLCLSAPILRAVTFVSTADPTFNTTPPTGALAGSGWQYEASFGPFLATAIGPHHFLTVKHIGIPASTIVYQGASYSIVGYHDDPYTDLRMFVVAEPVPVYAPIYSRSDELGHDIVVIGRGTQRGNPVYVGNTLVGWQWGLGDTVQRWGQNQVSAINSCYLYAEFDQNGNVNEAHLSSGDSGGAVFINDAGVWKLAGINYGVDGPFAYPAGGSTFYATLFDRRGLFDGSVGSVISGSTPDPSGFYSIRTSTELFWIRSMIAPALNAISTQAAVGAGKNDVVKASFVINGDPSQTKQVLVRGIGPSLKANGAPMTGRLLDPVIELYDASGKQIATNDNWSGGTGKKSRHKKKGKPVTAPNSIQNSGFAPTDPSEAALIEALPPGTYTAVLKGAKKSTGIGTLDVRDLDGSMDGPTLESLSGYGDTGTGANVLSSSVMVDSASGRLLIRAIGPELLNQGVTGALTDPTLELYDARGMLVATNDNWRSAPNSAEIQNTGAAPSDDREPAVLIAPAPGNYTVIVRGVNNTTGTCQVEATLLP